METIKSTSSKDYHWSKDSDEKGVLSFWVAFDERQNDDRPCMSSWFSKEFLEPEEEELVLSQYVEKKIQGKPWY